jgi:benzoylformate decarboxylase
MASILPNTTMHATRRVVKVRDAVIDLLRSLKMTTVFGNPGSTELPFLQDWPEDIRYILGLQEASVVAMADGYAQATGNAAFVNLHSAAGLGNGLGNLFTAYQNQAPLVVTAGQQARSLLLDHPYLFAESATEFPKPYVKWSCEPATAADVPAAIARAYCTAMMRPCGPTFVSIPIDDWEVESKPAVLRSVPREFAPDPERLRVLADAFTRSERPAIVVGPSVDADDAWDEVVALAERSNAAVWEAPVSSRASFPEDHLLFAGFLPAAPEALSAELSRYDFILVLGAPVFTYHIAGERSLDSSRIYLMTDDLDAAARAPVATSVLTTMRLGISALLDLLPSAKRSRPAPRKRAPEPKLHDPILAELVMSTVANVMPSDAIIVEEAPAHRNAMHDYLPIRRRGGFYTTASGGLGYALPAAVGIALAEAPRRVICLIGDGSALYSIQALWTAVRHELPLTVMVLNNRGYGALKAFSGMMRIKDAPGLDLPGLDFLAIAKGFGCTAHRVEAAKDLAPAMRQVFSSKSPTLLEVAVDSRITELYRASTSA